MIIMVDDMWGDFGSIVEQQATAIDETLVDLGLRGGVMTGQITGKEHGPTHIHHQFYLLDTPWRSVDEIDAALVARLGKLITWKVTKDTITVTVPLPRKEDDGPGSMVSQ